MQSKWKNLCETSLFLSSNMSSILENVPNLTQSQLRLKDFLKKKCQHHLVEAIIWKEETKYQNNLNVQISVMIKSQWMQYFDKDQNYSNYNSNLFN